MELDFWKNKWIEGKTRFHLNEINPLLIKYLPTNIPYRNTLVPLCGKSNDLLYLSKHSKNVLGVECSDIAVNEFFKINHIESKKSSKMHTAKDLQISILEDDFFNTEQFLKNTQNRCSTFDLIYDRAATVALPIEIRKRYHQVLKNLLTKNGLIFLISFEIDRDVNIGPPFSVNESYIRETFSQYKIEILYRSTQETNLKFESRQTSEVVYAITNI